MTNDSGQSLPVIQKRTPSRTQTTWKHFALHAARVLLLCCIVLLVRKQYRKAQLELFNNQVASSQPILSKEGQRIGTLISTFPVCNRFVGYSGSTCSNISVDPDGKISCVEIDWSGDTVEHVDMLNESTTFLSSFEGLDWNRPDEWPEIDSVTGATLTSIATRNAIVEKAGGTAISEKFNSERVGEILFTTFGSEIRYQLPFLGRLNEINKLNKVEGYFFVTASICDELNGYQGPTNTIVLLDSDKKVKRIEVVRSYDNKPYTGYMDDDEQFQAIFRDKSLLELSTMDRLKMELDGVSGATMTSHAVMDSIPIAAKKVLEPQIQMDQSMAFRGRWIDLASIAICILGIAIAFTRLKGIIWLRRIFLALVIIVLGFVSGDLLSIALMSGWSQLSVPWRSVPGLAFLVIAAFAVPIFSKRNVYCQQLCPFGAAQQLAINRGPKIPVRGRLAKTLNAIPVLLLLATLLTAMGVFNLNLAAIEPFNAFSFRAARWMTIGIAVIGLAASFCVPMAYCRYGCPTGTVLSFLKFRGDSDRFSSRDFVAILFLTLAFILGMR